MSFRAFRGSKIFYESFIEKLHLLVEVRALARRGCGDCRAAMNELTVERALSIAAFIRGSLSATFVTLSAGY